MDFFCHEMLVTRLVDHGGPLFNAGFGAANSVARLIKNLDAAAGQDGAIALLKIGDFMGEGAKRDCVRTDIGFTIAMTNGQGRPFARGDHQIIFALKEETKRKRAFKP